MTYLFLILLIWWLIFVFDVTDEIANVDGFYTFWDTFREEGLKECVLEFWRSLRHAVSIRFIYSIFEVAATLIAILPIFYFIKEVLL